MNLFTRFGLTLIITTLIAACGESEPQTNKTAPVEKVTITHTLGTISVNKNPQRVAVFDFGALDTLEALDIDIIGLPKANLPSYLTHYNDARYLNFGGLKEPDFEALHAAKPDVIIISARQAQQYEQFSEIAPTLYVGIDYANYLPSLEENVTLLAGLFIKETKANELMSQLKADIAAVQQTTQAMPERGLIILVNDGKVSAYGAQSRFGFIHDVLGVKQADDHIAVATHGQSVTFEYIVKVNPDYLFVIDRSAVVGNSETSAKQVVENILVQQTAAYTNNHIVYLDANTWYLSGGGLGSTRTMLEDIKKML